MRKVRIRLPATITDLDPTLQTIALALRLYLTVEVSQRTDTDLRINLQGEGATRYAEMPFAHPVMLGMSRFFQSLERTVLGLNVTIHNDIPLGVGLGAESAMVLAGMLCANDLLGTPANRDEVLQVAAPLVRPEAMTAAISGGVGLALFDGQTVLHRSFPARNITPIILLPYIEGYRRPTLPEQVPRALAFQNAGRIALLIEALRDGDKSLLATLLRPSPVTAQITHKIAAFPLIQQVAQGYGAFVITPVSGGPALMILADKHHEQIAEDLQLVCKGAGMTAQVWVLPIDTQGIVYSAMQSIG